MAERGPKTRETQSRHHVTITVHLYKLEKATPKIEDQILHTKRLGGYSKFISYLGIFVAHIVIVDLIIPRYAATVLPSVLCSTNCIISNIHPNDSHDQAL